MPLRHKSETPEEPHLSAVPGDKDVESPSDGRSKQPSAEVHTRRRIIKCGSSCSGRVEAP